MENKIRPLALNRKNTLYAKRDAITAGHTASDIDALLSWASSKLKFT